MLDRDIRIFVLRALLATLGSPMPDDSLRSAVRNNFPHVAITQGELRELIQSTEAAGLISGTNDEVFGLMWALTPKGKIKAQQL